MPGAGFENGDWGGGKGTHAQCLVLSGCCYLRLARYPEASPVQAVEHQVLLGRQMFQVFWWEFKPRKFSIQEMDRKRGRGRHKKVRRERQGNIMKHGIKKLRTGREAA